MKVIHPGAFIAAALLCAPAAPAAGYELPSPLTARDVPRLARQHRDEVTAARARSAAARQRPAIVSALEDPVVSPAIDHYPFEMMDEAGRRYDWSISVEQALPLSGIRGHRRRSAEAEAARLDAESDRTALDVAWSALDAFYMLHERRGMRQVLDQQLDLAKQLVASTASRYAAGNGSQAEVLRAEVELARLAAQRTAADAGVRAAEAMLNVELGRDPGEPVPPLLAAPADAAPPDAAAVTARALALRPELRSGSAGIRRADAELEVMRSMYAPMAMLRAGTASTMAEGPGAMLMLGVSVPIWRGRLQAGVAEAKSMQAMARADLQAMHRMVAGEAAAARELVVAAQAEYGALNADVLPRARSALSSALAAYSSGQTPLTGVLDALESLWSVQIESVMAESRLGAAWARLERMTGTFEDATP